ncbi:Tetratricopeptide-like helical [Cordyceps fumosorosea ARSEF 2679]|uniref:Tetratricopeptide-like helical n=1 Tax=Cordyceps fumosorosea (strain ARSEF 2679) TaxID=1081104 RepID=A0A167NY05_CORFA|nr:Tetratricopeptide-like helical [Cordyceps fumosorosea ARSEF 2679]OAA56072.1 Tetratricopeptide-like helical [Cordyceps fumosorosea ARSEF 2679]
MHLEEAAVDIFVELISFQRHCIKFLRDTDREAETGWQEFHVGKDKVKTSIDGILEMVWKHVRFASHVEEMQRLQMILSLATNSPISQANIPFSNLPVTRNARFFDRDNIIEKIDDHFARQSMTKGPRSLALYGLGGVGKTHVALKYASVKTEEFPAILWIKGETAESLVQSFSEIAVRLKLHGAGISKHEENRILVLDWLQKTNLLACRWLLVYDNAETFELLLKYWPVASQGSVTITSRNHSFAYEPAETGIEVLPFDRQSGLGFILHMLSLDIATGISSQDVQSSLQLSDKLSGHAFAISQMTGLIHRRSWSIAEFIAIYDRNTRQIHGMPGINSLDASLSQGCANMLGIMCYLTPNSIPQTLFKPVDVQDLPPELGFLS